jgi:hypothetical protein
VGIFIFICLSIALFGTIMIAFCRFFKLKRSSQFSTVNEGFNLRRRIYSTLSYVHFFSVRFIVIILMYLSQYQESVYLWILLANIQVIYIFLNLMEIYPQPLNRFMGLLAEAEVLVVISYCTSQQILKEQNEEQRYKSAYIFAYFFIAFNIYVISIIVVTQIKDTIQWFFRTLLPKLRRCCCYFCRRRTVQPEQPEV